MTSTLLSQRDTPGICPRMRQQPYRCPSAHRAPSVHAVHLLPALAPVPMDVVRRMISAPGAALVLVQVLVRVLAPVLVLVLLPMLHPAVSLVNNPHSVISH